MRDLRFLLKTRYTGARALVVGINVYLVAPPLSYAVSDATAIRDVLVEALGFPAENVLCLLDSEATRSRILREYLRFTREDVDLDERVIVFFAGHGHTQTGIRGEVGFLVPHDGNPADLSTLIRWSELTENAELVRAKHALFIMDACYGGLAIARNLQPGSARFLKDMMLRYSRQVLTAGKADEVVSDAGGPLAGHSVFTGHLIEGLRGKAAGPGGVMTAHSLMGYVYARVANDVDSHQTPSYGHFDGDGDLILRAPDLAELETPETMDIDELVLVPYPEPLPHAPTRAEMAARTKQLLANDALSIELHDCMVDEVRRFLSETSGDYFNLNDEFADDVLFARIERYERAVAGLSSMTACIAYWARAPHGVILRKALSRSADRLDEVRGGKQVWIELRWYPIVVELYCSGIAAIAGDRYDSLCDIFLAPVSSTRYGETSTPFIERVSDAILEFARIGLFKLLPGHERHHTPMSEYLYKTLQPGLDDLLFLGAEYEKVFDEFEILFALVRADISKRRGEGVWGPTGRFGWKQRRGGAPLQRMIEAAAVERDSWPPIKAGLFGGSYDRFESVARQYLDAVSKLGWF